MPPSLRRLAATTLAVVAAFGLSTVPASAATGCRSVTVPASAGLAGPVTVSGTLCTPVNATGVVQVLVHGATYNRQYWSGEGVPAFDYTSVANAAGTTTLAIDAAGVGQSTQPFSALLTGVEEAGVYHQVIAAVRAGGVDGIAHPEVFAVGHSIGSLGLVIEAAQFHDLTGLVLTGYSHFVSATAIAAIMAGTLSPADLAGFPQLDPGYLTTRPGTRGADFHNAADVDPAVVAGDEANRDVISAGVVADTIPLGLVPATSRQITVPVLEVDGSQDQIFCGPLTTPGCVTSGALFDHEHADFGGSMAAEVVPDAGHDVTLAANSAHSDRVVQDWAASVLAGAPITGPIA